jgi:hypothetical protein
VGRTNTIARLADYRASDLPEAPVFFASRLVVEDRETKIVEYCAIDRLGAVRLMVTVTWNAEPLHPGLWTPSSAALAAMLLIGQLLDNEQVVVAHLLEDELMQPLRPDAREGELIEMRELLGRRDLRARVPDLDDQMAMLRFDPSRPDSALGDAQLLHASWNFVAGSLRREHPSAALPPIPMPAAALRPAIVLPNRMHVPGWFWGVGAAIAVQLLALSAPWLFPHG